MVVLDSDFLIDLSYEVDSAVKKFNEIKTVQEKLFIPTLVLYEILAGIENADNPTKEQQRFSNILKDQIILPFDEECAKIAAKIYSELSRKGELIDDIDIMIASVALKHNQALITRNIKHFSRIPRLKIESYI